MEIAAVGGTIQSATLLQEARGYSGGTEFSDISVSNMEEIFTEHITSCHFLKGCKLLKNISIKDFKGWQKPHCQNRSQILATGSNFSEKQS